MILNLRALIDGMAAERDLAVQSEEKYYKRTEEFVCRNGDTLVALADLLPERWTLTMNHWWGVMIENAVENGETIKKEEFRSVLKSVEKAFGVTLEVRASQSDRIHARGTVTWQATGGDMQATTILVCFVHGDCKIRFEEKTVQVPILDDDCLKNHGKPKPAKPE
jgi:hypothetical protein